MTRPAGVCFCWGSMHTCAYCLNTACFRKYSFYLLCVCVTERKFVCMCVCLCLLTFTSTPENFGETVVYTAAVLDATFGPVWRLIQLTVNCWPHQVKPVTETCQHTCDLKTQGRKKATIKPKRSCAKLFLSLFICPFHSTDSLYIHIPNVFVHTAFRVGFYL